jgi:uncharacterized protein YjdB
MSVLCAESASAVNGHLFVVMSGKVGMTSQTQTGLWKAIKSKAVYSATDNALDMIQMNQEMVFIAGDSFGEESILQDCLGIYEGRAKTSNVQYLLTISNAAINWSAALLPAFFKLLVFTVAFISFDIS